MSDRRRHGWSRAVAAALLAAALVAAGTGSAPAVNTGTTSTTLSNFSTGASGVTYTFAGYTARANEIVTSARITFPADTVVSGATAVSPAGSVSVAGRTVTYTFTTPIRNAPISISIGGITNPTTPNTYNAGNITFTRINPANGKAMPDDTVTTANYFVGDPWLVISVSRSSIDWVIAAPEVTSPAQSVTLNVDSSHPYTVSRTITGDAALIGLNPGTDTSWAGTAGVAAYTDDYTATVPWTTSGDATYTVTVSYTVVQN